MSVLDAIGIPLVMGAVRAGVWHWELGDPDTGSLVVTGLYLLTFVSCLFAARSASDELDSWRFIQSEPMFWSVVAVILLLMGINKQLDFHSLVEVVILDLLQESGLNEFRSTIEISFIFLLAVAALATTLGIVRWVSKWSAACHLAAVGLGLQTAFIVLRVASFYYSEQLRDGELYGIRIHLLFESVGLVLMLVASIMRVRPRPDEWSD